EYQIIERAAFSGLLLLTNFYPFLFSRKGSYHNNRHSSEILIWIVSWWLSLHFLKICPTNI
ncbi:MAG TPA: hypothetical protein VE643_02220, partial [Nitrososphaeraceae archaeon]|nr:hypothetical protein [Nitrososphaeraceae archaeon]